MFYIYDVNSFKNICWKHVNFFIGINKFEATFISMRITTVVKWEVQLIVFVKNLIRIYTYLPLLIFFSVFSIYTYIYPLSPPFLFLFLNSTFIRFSISYFITLHKFHSYVFGNLNFVINIYNDAKYQRKQVQVLLFTWFVYQNY